MVALSSLFAPSSTGELHQIHCDRLRRHLEDMQPLAHLESGHSTTSLRTDSQTRNKRFLNTKLDADASRSGAQRAKPSGERWRLRRGVWYYEDPNPPPPDP